MTVASVRIPRLAIYWTQDYHISEVWKWCSHLLLYRLNGEALITGIHWATLSQLIPVMGYQIMSLRAWHHFALNYLQAISIAPHSGIGRLLSCPLSGCVIRPAYRCWPPATSGLHSTAQSSSASEGKISYSFSIGPAIEIPSLFLVLTEICLLLSIKN